jgi:AP-1 complex subunit beta-1
LAAAAAAAAGGAGPSAQAQSNVENLLDIDFDGGAPASAQTEPSSGMSGLEGLAGTPVRVASPAAGTPAAQASNNLDDLLGVFGDSGAAQPSSGGANSGSGSADLMNGFSGLDLSGNAGSSQNNQSKKSNDDIMSLF